MVLFRRLLGDVLRERRMDRGMTLREVSKQARVSLGYISEIERGQKEASSELLASLCGALEAPLSDVLREVSDAVAIEEAAVAATPILVKARRRDDSSPPLPDRFARVPTRWQGLSSLPGPLVPVLRCSYARPSMTPSWGRGRDLGVRSGR